MNTGIYRILCIINNKNYVGACNDFIDRENVHFRELRNNKHGNKELQEDYNKYGIDAFKFIIIEICDIKNLKKQEDYWIKHFNSYIIGYNKNKTGNKLPIKEQSYRNNKRRKRLTYEHKNNISRSMKNKNIGVNNPTNKLSLNDCFKIKQMLLEETKERKQDKDLRLANIFSISSTTIMRIKMGKHWSSNDLGGGYKDWIKN